MKYTVNDFAKLYAIWYQLIKENKEYLIALDGVAGDGDLGLSMHDGFKAMMQYAFETKEKDLGVFLITSGKIMNSHASSCLGTLLAFGFKKAGNTILKRKFIYHTDIGNLISSLEEGIFIAGQAKVGEKTILDGLSPAVKILQHITNEKDLPLLTQKAYIAAQQGSASTIGMYAHWGRAARRGEDARQTLDPGSVVAVLLIQGIAQAFYST